MSSISPLMADVSIAIAARESAGVSSLQVTSLVSVSLTKVEAGLLSGLLFWVSRGGARRESTRGERHHRRWRFGVEGRIIEQEPLTTAGAAVTAAASRNEEHKPPPIPAVQVVPALPKPTLPCR